jgi:hypothetical protein
MSNKYAFAGGSQYNKGSSKRLETTIFYYGTVISNFDELGANRIKVRILGIDDSVTDSELSFAFPMIQKFFHVVPKIGETVMIFIPDVRNPFIDRLYLGPIISQPQMLNRDSDLFSSKTTLDSGIKEASPSPKTVPENRGVYPDPENVAVQGRNNSDLIFKDKEVLIRAGQFNVNTAKGDIPKFNKINPSFIQVKHDIILKKATDKTNAEKGGVINIVSNKINLLTHKNGNPRFILNNPDSMISDTEIQKIVENAHPLAFGDNLIELIKIFMNAFLNHVHPYPGMKPQDLSGENNIPKLLEYDLSSILSKNIRIN